MGEYAIRKSDGREIKIGTCEDMYYLRYSDRDKVQPIPGNVDPMDEKEVPELRWRLPFPDEDGLPPGKYDGPRADVKLYGFEDRDTAKDPGTLQIRTKYGMVFNITCYHGEKLPEETKEIRPFWNGKGPAYELSALKFINGELWGVYRCVEFGHAWRAPLREIIPFIGGDNHDLRDRLIEWYCPDLKKGGA